MHPRVEWSKRSGNIIAIPILSGPHTNMSVYDLRKGPDFAAAHESAVWPLTSKRNVRSYVGSWGISRPVMLTRSFVDPHPTPDIHCALRHTILVLPRPMCGPLFDHFVGGPRRFARASRPSACAVLRSGINLEIAAVGLRFALSREPRRRR